MPHIFYRLFKTNQPSQRPEGDKQHQRQRDGRMLSIYPSHTRGSLDTSPNLDHRDLVHHRTLQSTSHLTKPTLPRGSKTSLVLGRWGEQGRWDREFKPAHLLNNKSSFPQSILLITPLSVPFSMTVPCPKWHGITLAF